MRRFFVALMVVIAMVSITNNANALENHYTRNQKQNINLDRNGRYSHSEIRDTIRLAERRWSVSGGQSKALSVAECESGFSEHAGTTYKGVYQFAQSTFDGDYDRFREMTGNWNIKDNVWNGRSNVMIAMIHAHRSGWGAWSCA